MRILNMSLFHTLVKYDEIWLYRPDTLIHVMYKGISSRSWKRLAATEGVVFSLWHVTLGWSVGRTISLACFHVIQLYRYTSINGEITPSKKIGTVSFHHVSTERERLKVKPGPVKHEHSSCFFFIKKLGVFPPDSHPWIYECFCGSFFVWIFGSLICTPFPFVSTAVPEEMLPVPSPESQLTWQQKRWWRCCVPAIGGHGNIAMECRANGVWKKGKHWYLAMQSSDHLKAWLRNH